MHRIKIELNLRFVEPLLLNQTGWKQIKAFLIKKNCSEEREIAETFVIYR